MMGLDEVFPFLISSFKRNTFFVARNEYSYILTFPSFFFEDGDE